MLVHGTKAQAATAIVAGSWSGIEEWTKDYSPSTQHVTALRTTETTDQDDDYTTDIAVKLTIKHGGKRVKECHSPCSYIHSDSSPIRFLLVFLLCVLLPNQQKTTLQ
jgi:hypothetical protein